MRAFGFVVYGLHLHGSRAMLAGLLALPAIGRRAAGYYVKMWASVRSKRAECGGANCGGNAKLSEFAGDFAGESFKGSRVVFRALGAAVVLSHFAD